MTGERETARIRQLNDIFRKSFIGGRVYLTEGIRALGQDFESACVERVQKHRRFAEGNDPYGEHDFGAFKVQRRKCFWGLRRNGTENLHKDWPRAENPSLLVHGSGSKVGGS